MPTPKQRSRSVRKVYVRTPGGRVVIHYRKKIPKIARCAICKRKLNGIPRDVKGLAYSEKRVERPYGGNLCSECMRRLFRKEVMEVASLIETGVKEG